MFLFKVSYAQRYEAGLFVGGNNVIGDISSGYYVATTGVTFGGVFKWSLNDRLALRGNLEGSLVRQNIGKSWFPYIDSLSLDHRSSVITMDAIAEWNVLNYDLRKGQSSTPFIYVGLGGIIYSPRVSVDSIDVGVTGVTMSIPFGIGYKHAISKSWVLAADLGFRFTLADDLDGTKSAKIGNLNSNDWFTTVGITLTYAFGRPLGIAPCPCKDSKSEDECVKKIKEKYREEVKEYKKYRRKKSLDEEDEWDDDDF